MTPRPIPMRALVVDDDVMSRELLVVLLEGEGYAVESAESGEAALASLRRGKSAPDLVLADFQMPGTTGAQLARKLRRACGPATLLLAISASQPPQKAIALFDGFLMKPFEMDQVAAALRTRSYRHSEPGRSLAADSPPKREKRVVAGPAHIPVPISKSISVSASVEKVASKSRMSVQIQEPLPAECVNTEKTNTVLNESIYRQLAGSIPTQQLQEMYALCVNDARKRIAVMRTLAAARDSAQFVREAHSIKGGCGMLGATELHRMAAELEANGLATRHAGAARDVNSLDELSSACDRLERMLRTRL